jgi:hypothetical protein
MSRFTGSLTLAVIVDIRHPITHIPTSGAGWPPVQDPLKIERVFDIHKPPATRSRVSVVDGCNFVEWMIVRLVGLVRSRETWKSEASGPDQTALREELLGSVPQGFEAVRVHGIGEKSQTLELLARPTKVREAVGEGGSYREARAAVEAQVGEQEALLYVTAVEG